MDARKAFHDAYTELIGRNHYSQVKREYVFSPASDGVYYSDCSSSGMASYQRAGLDVPLWNTAGMHYNGRNVNVTVTGGHIAAADIARLRVGMALMFRGNDPDRPLQIGHVEYIYRIDGPAESDVTICGHGSGRPSLKNLEAYCSNREAQRANNGATKGLVEVLDFFPEDVPEKTVSGTLTVTAAALNVRTAPGGRVVGTVRRGDSVAISAQTNVGGAYWFQIPGGWVSGAFVRGWVQQGGRYWYTPGDGTPYASNVVVDNYCLDRDGWLVTPDRMTQDGLILY